MSKLLIKPTPGYTKTKNDSPSGNYPNTVVEAIYYEEEQKTLAEKIKELENGSGGGSCDCGPADFRTKNLHELDTASEATYYSSLDELESACSLTNGELHSIMNGKAICADVANYMYIDEETGWKYEGWERSQINASHNVRRTVEDDGWDEDEKTFFRFGDYTFAINHTQGTYAFYRSGC